MNIQKLPSGSYRIKQMYKGQYYSVTVDHKPTQKEAVILLSEKMQDIEIKGNTKSFNSCALEYISSKSNILSPSTIAGYHKILRQIDDKFKNTNIYDMNQLQIQTEVNRYANGRSPKTVANFHGFISSVFGLFRPNMSINTTLPQKIKYEPYTPTDEDIKKILDASKDNTKYHICFQLGILSLRRSEVCALTLGDVDFDHNTISISKAFVYDKDNKPVIKPYTKSTEGKRTIYIPDSLKSEIRQNNGIIDVLPHNIVRVLHEYQDTLKIPRFRFHDLRHYFATYCHSQGMSDANIMASGGWKTDYTMKSVYRHERDQEKMEQQQMIANKLLS